MKGFLYFFVLFWIPLCADFDALMGKGTSHWKHISQGEDIKTLDFARNLYEKNIRAQFTEEGKYKIPPTVHFIWLGPKPFPPESVKNIRMWIRQNPGWRFKFWTDRDREAPCEGMDIVYVKDFSFYKLGKHFNESRNWGEKSDLLRYEILYQQGGVYADHDANCLKSFNGLHRGYDFFCCLEPPHRAFVGRNITCGNGVIGSRALHPALASVIDWIDQKWEALGNKFQGLDPYSKVEIVMQRTYIALTHVLENALDQNGNVDIVFPASYFFPKSGLKPIYSEHFFAEAWDDSKVKKTETDRHIEKTLGKLRQKNRNLNGILTGLLIVNMLLWGVYFVRRQNQ